jgi:Na+/proline symporter
MTYDETSFWTLYLLGFLSHFKMWRMVFDANKNTKDLKTFSFYIALIVAILWPAMAVVAVVVSIFRKKKEPLTDEDMFVRR